MLCIVAALAQVLAVLFECLDSFLKNLVVLGGRCVARIQFVHLVIMKFYFPGKILTPSFKCTHFVLELAILELKSAG